MLAAAPAAADSWYEAYDRAEGALAAQNWSEAVRHLNSALEQKPSSGSNLRTYGMRFVDYFPYLKLGIAYFHLGQTDAALQALETEERQGALGRSAEAQAQLLDYRGRIEKRKAAEELARASRAPAVIAAGLTSARELEQQGRLDDALAAVDRALAVSPDEPEAQQLRRRLLTMIADRLRLEDEADRFTKLVLQGKHELELGQLRQAAARFSEALELKRDDEAQTLLAEAQGRIRAELAARPGVTERQRFIVESFTRASGFEAAGELGRALAELQAIFALDPQNPEARVAQRRVIQAQSAAESGTRGKAIGELLGEAERLLAAGDTDGALRAANRTLVLEATNPAALRIVTQAYTRLNRALLAPGDAPPALLLDDPPPSGPGGEAGQGIIDVRSPDLVITGTVYDRAAVKVQVLDRGTPLGEAVLRGREFQGLWITDFRWAHAIPPGLSLFEIVALDDAGNRTAVHYRVRYFVPFLRTLWFPLSILLVLSAAVAAILTLRARRRRRLRRTRFNPYIAGAPILEQARFFGRQQLRDYVLRRVSNNSVMLYGERRIGKTSFQHELKRNLTTLEDPDHAFYPVFIDLQGTPQEKFFGTLAAEVFHELAPKLGGLQPSSPTGQDSYGYIDFVKDIQRVLKALSERTPKKVKLVLQIDEVDELNEYDPRINQKLRSLFMRAFADNLVSVVSGVAIKKHWEREGSPWYNFFQEIEIKALDPAEARSLIEAPVRGVFSFEEGTADEIVRRTAGKPYLIQRLCSGLVDRMHQEQRRRITSADVDDACRVEGL